MITEQNAKAEFEKWYLKTFPLPNDINKPLYWRAFLAGLDAAYLERGILLPESKGFHPEDIETTCIPL